jgi:hypothetical protein
LSTKTINDLGDLLFGLRSDATVINIGYHHDLVLEEETLVMLGLLKAKLEKSFCEMFVPQFWCNGESIQTFLMF